MKKSQVSGKYLGENVQILQMLKIHIMNTFYCLKSLKFKVRGIL